jgi:hypothetical protein
MEQDSVVERALEAIRAICRPGETPTVAVPENPPLEAASIPPDAPDAWREDFIRWALERCVLREDYEDSQSVGSLLIDFAEWAIDHDAVPAPRDAFEALLEEAGFRLKDGMAMGIVLKADLEAVLLSQKVTIQ